MHGPIMHARLLLEQTRKTTPLAIVAGGLGCQELERMDTVKAVWFQVCG